MEKQNRKPPTKKSNSETKIGSKAQKSLYLSKIKHAEKILKSKTTQIIVPLLKIQKKVSMKFEIFNKDYNEIIKKAETACKEINTHLEENKNDNMNLTDVQLNQKYANDHENMIKFYENIIDKLDLFTKLISSGEYTNIIQEFDKINNIIDNNDNNIENNNNENDINMKDELEQLEKNYVILKRNNKKNNIKKLIGINSNKILKKLGSNSKPKKPDTKNGSIKKSKHNSIDLLEALQEEYKDNYYIQKLSKTFLKRRLFKNIIYRHIFNYEEDGSIKDDKLRSSGESTIYKYGKLTIKFKNDELKEDNCDKLIKYFQPAFKQSFIKIDNENKQFIIAGKLINLLNEFLDKMIKKNLYVEYNIIKITVEFYEFYEELVNEFNEKESNVKIINCDDKYLKILRQDWESLNTVRDYVKKSKNKLSLNLNDENVNNEANDENNVSNGIKEEEKKEEKKLEIREEFIQL
jgi:hypothetical protein